jgi:hypothetical protein
MKTCRVEFEAPRKHFEITYETAKSVEYYEFWGERFSVREHSIVNARATIEIPSSWTMVDSSRDAAEMASGDRFYGRFIAKVPVGEATPIDEWTDALVDAIPQEWEVLEIWSDYENSNR